MARSRETKIELTAYDDLFETDQSREEAALSKIRDMLMARCSVDTTEYFEREDFGAIVNFNTPQTLNAIGIATSDIAEMALREISLSMLNQTKEFATDVLVSSLRPKEAEALIRSPMQEIFGYDPYRTSLGMSAVEYLKDISGCHPTFLARACKEVFDYYVNETHFPIAKTQLTQRDVGNAIAGYVSHLQLDSFDILFVEDGDDVEKPEERKTYQYLKCVAELSLASYDHRTADIHEVTDQMRRILGAIEEERIRGVLQARHIIRFTEGGRLCIETGLFLTYIQQRNGGK